MFKHQYIFPPILRQNILIFPIITFTIKGFRIFKLFSIVLSRAKFNEIKIQYYI